MWLNPYATSQNYSTDDFKIDIEDLWEKIRPLYLNLHAYVRWRLRNSEPFKASFGKEQPIPAHMLGNMWAQSWENIYDLVIPYEDEGAELIDISDALETNITDVHDMFRYAENFFTSIGLFNMTQNFIDHTMYEQPENASANCHASAWDFYSVDNPQYEGDYRIKMCTNLNQEDFIVIHHEMGHIQYFMSYSINSSTENIHPLIYRDGANPGFHEAIGDTIALSVSTATHLEWLYENITGIEAQGKNLTEDLIMKRNINQLMKTALEKVAFIPYAYILDKYRWDIFAGEDTNLNYNWWKLRVEEQGIKPPTLREKSTDFDAGCKYHVAAGIPYIRWVRLLKT